MNIKLTDIELTLCLWQGDTSQSDSLLSHHHQGKCFQNIVAILFNNTWALSEQMPWGKLIVLQSVFCIVKATAAFCSEKDQSIVANLISLHSLWVMSETLLPWLHDDWPWAAHWWLLTGISGIYLSSYYGISRARGISHLSWCLWSQQQSILGTSHIITEH